MQLQMQIIALTKKCQGMKDDVKPSETAQDRGESNIVYLAFEQLVRHSLDAKLIMTGNHIRVLIALVLQGDHMAVGNACVNAQGERLLACDHLVAAAVGTLVLDHLAWTSMN
jgi:hypothetical protein